MQNISIWNASLYYSNRIWTERDTNQMTEYQLGMITKVKYFVQRLEFKIFYKSEKYNN